ncbi:AAA family ATPase [Streptomyces sp. LBUM 1478]|nr:AAA family ATPase [Streptomyces sp. LBUM 1484]MBP5882851.1 AAA family ATPase [Streptomyces sp. LBUM 1487]MBP5894280.1 AAA family ATPase [Streptomyces sp. LBUM 1481]MBP5898919.1 AAA family ATPase [Streptomyces sp. LBUM 1488]MBP5905433.1 AAA family ATPase [Streptomyces sp. LBUM 1478]MBP5924541.1 AAA family ATPase [Streptomyces sp. LBUM 1483]MBP5932201.1 AAA family ATPase [Streptomyces sp. LBUM 1479]QTU50833.1 AAA family ATPase [Streptomyces sp. LBUM 1482]QTU58956.1 AAA family ATPase [Strep
MPSPFSPTPSSPAASSAPFASTSNDPFASLSSPALVGRRAERELLAAAVRAARDGRGSSVFVLGEPGIGKSRLVEDAASAAAGAGARVLRGRAASAGRAVPLRPLAEAVFSGLRGEGAPSDGDLGLYEPLLSRLCGSAPQDGAPLVGYAEAVLRLLHVLGRDGGCVLVLEDLHDADADTLAVVDYLTDNLTAQRAVLLATLRGGSGPALDLAEAAASRRTARTVRLARLGPAGTAELAARCLGHDTAEEVPAAVLERLHTVSEGVPFVVEELLRAMVDGGGLVRDEGSRWTVAGSLDADVPDTVAAAVLQRVDQLPPAGIALLEAAAVLGRRFPVDIAARAAGLDHATALTQLRHAARAHLVSGATAASDPGWHTFRHALTAEAITRRLLPPERAALCLAAADAIEAAKGVGREGREEDTARPAATGLDGATADGDGPTRPGTPDGTYPGTPAAAPSSAPGRPRPPLGAEAGDDLYRLAAELCVAAGRPARAAVLLVRAGRQAVARGALLTAVELLDRGLELTAGAPDAPPEAVARLLEELLGTLVLTGDVRRVPELGDRLDRVLTVWGAPAARRAAGFLTRARAAATAQQWEEGLTAVRRARELLGELPDPAARAALDAVAAHLVLNSQRPDRLESARALAEGAVATAEEVGLPEVACKALNMLGYCLRPRDLGAAEEAFARLVATAEAHALPVWRIRGLLELGVLDRVRFTGTDRLLAARGAAEDTGAVLMTAWADMHLTLAHILRDEHERAAESARRLRATARRLRLREVELIGAGVDGILAASLGEREKLDTTLRTLERALAGRSAGALWGYADTSVWGWAQGICSLLREEPDRALAEFTEADGVMRALPSTGGVTGFLGPYLLLRTLRGATGWDELDGPGTERLAQVQWDRPFAGWSRAVLLGREGRAAEAAKTAEEALTGTSTVPLAAHLCLRLGAEAALADGWGRPVAWLRTAEQFFHERGTTRVSAACRALLRESGSPVPRRRQGHDAVPGELRRAGVTAREYEVLRLLGARLGNQEIAEHLFLSPRTVEKHLASLRDRTGRPDRAALIALARKYADDR